MTGSLHHPVIRFALLTFAAMGAAITYITISGYFPGPAQWFPWGVYPGIFTPQYVITVLFLLIIFGFLDWIRFRGLVHKSQVLQGLKQ